jgi:hypothetical protein
MRGHGSITRFQLAHIMRFVQCDLCEYASFKFSPLHNAVKLLIWSWLECIRPWNITDYSEYEDFVKTNIMQSSSYQIFLENFKSIYIHLFGASNYTRYFLVLTDSAPYFLIFCNKMHLTAQDYFGEHAVESLNDVVKFEGIQYIHIKSSIQIK